MDSTNYVLFLSFTFLIDNLLFRKIFQPYLVRQTRTTQEPLQSKSFEKSLMTSVSDTLKWSFIWRRSRWAILMIFWRNPKGMLRKNPLNWILKNLNQLFLKWILRWKIFQLRRRYRVIFIGHALLVISIRGIYPYLSCMLSKMTIQVASQQGVYLAKCFNRMEECEKYPEGPLRFRGTGRHRFRPFRYNLNNYFKLCVCG